MECNCKHITAGMAFVVGAGLVVASALFLTRIKVDLSCQKLIAGIGMGIGGATVLGSATYLLLPSNMTHTIPPYTRRIRSVGGN